MMFTALNVANPVLPVLGELNRAFGGLKPTVGPDQASAFRPGEPLSKALVRVLDLHDKDLNEVLSAYVQMLPGGFQESLRSIIHYALSSDPPVLLNFSWAPAYDFELTIWEIVEPAPARGGISIALKGRYPDHNARYSPR